MMTLAKYVLAFMGGALVAASVAWYVIEEMALNGDFCHGH
jgi:hypothetical protein